jgi:hypothetical protein
MWLLYIFALIPAIIGFIIWIANDEVNIIEWLIGSATAFIVAGLVHACAIFGMTHDKEVWSGRIIRAVHYPEWIEEYQVAVYKTVTHTDSKGNRHTEQVFSHYETRHRTHNEYYEAKTDLDYSKIIDKNFFKEIVKNFGNLTTETPYKSGFDSGDKNIYVAYNKTGYIYPATDIRSFENRIKAAPSVFSYPKVPKNVKVYEYPYPENWRISNRLLGENRISINEFDKMNSRLGFKKRVNVIMINFTNQDSSIAQYQEAKFIGGKKNDIVLCYGLGWAYCFGWTEKTLCKRNLETILLTNPINDNILPIIEKEIVKNYIIKDWSKFDYITIEPKSGTYLWYFITMFITQIGLWILFIYNDFGKNYNNKTIKMKRYYYH